MGQISMTVRMDSDLKKTFDTLCSQFGMSANTAMNVFAKAVVQRGKIPFEIRGDKTAELSSQTRMWECFAKTSAVLDGRGLM